MWNWQQSKWPKFSFDPEPLQELEQRFVHQSGVFSGSIKHFKNTDTITLASDIMTIEAVSTSEIEGETINRDSVQSSLRRHFGLQIDTPRIAPADQGIADMMVSVYEHYDQPLTNELLFQWHEMIMAGRRDLDHVGAYRAHEDPMQVVSGPLHRPRIHFEAPPSQSIHHEMKRFLAWQHQILSEAAPFSALTYAGLAHLYFVSIHPFEDGNGRIARAITQKMLSQSLHQPILLALSQIIQQQRNNYYDRLESNNKELEVTEWLVWFADIVLEAQVYTQKLVNFLLERTRLYDMVRGTLNLRQEKALERMFREGIEGFKGGLSAENYIRITRTSRATATRDLVDLVTKNALIKTGERKGTRYHLNIQVD